MYMQTHTQWQEESLMGNDAKKAPKVQKTKQHISLPRLVSAEMLQGHDNLWD